jgi:hypothetical protein
LEPFARTAGQNLSVRRVERPEGSPWEILVVGTSEAGQALDRSVLRDLMARADQEGASQVVLVQRRERRLVLGILRQFRYWTQSRARLCALTILEEHFKDLVTER